MASRSKLRRLSVFSLPAVVAAGALIVAWAAMWQRSDMIARLDNSISHGDSRQALIALERLSAISNPPGALLVSAAVSKDPETANAAQAAIDRLLRNWQRDLQLHQRYGTIASQLTELAKSLAAAQLNFSGTGRLWLDSAVRKILHIANMFTPSETPMVAVHCDAILVASGVSNSQAWSGPSPRFEEVVTPALVDDSRTRSGSAPSTNSTQQATDGRYGKLPPSENVPAPYIPPTQTEPIAPPIDAAARGAENLNPTNELRGHDEGPADASLADNTPSISGSAQRLGAPPPVFRILPAMPINVAPERGDALSRLRPDSRVATDGLTPTSNSPLAAKDSRELLKTWVSSDDDDVRPIELELTRRGFGRLSKPLVRQFFSDDPQERTRLVDKILAQPGGGSEAWLLLLASDTDADVRLFAVTFMATSNNPALVEKAWQAAIRDHDPRVAHLAGRLRERREGPLRR